MTTIYVDVLIGLNLFVNFFLLAATSKLTRYPIKTGRNLLASLGLSFPSLLILLPQMGWAAELLLRLVLASCGVAAGFGFPGIRGYLRLLAAFFSASFAFAGIMLGLWYLFHPAGLIINNGMVYLDISPLLLVAATMLSYLILTLLRKNFGKAPALDTSVTLHLQQAGRTLTVQAKLDTGFMLHDLYQDLPIVLLSPACAGRLFTPEEMGYRLIPYETVKGSGLLRSGLCHKVTADYQGRRRVIPTVVVAVGEQEFHDEYKALVGCDFIERMNMEYGKLGNASAGTVVSDYQRPHRLHQRSGGTAAAAEKGTGTDADGTSESR